MGDWKLLWKLYGPKAVWNRASGLKGPVCWSMSLPTLEKTLPVVLSRGVGAAGEPKLTIVFNGCYCLICLFLMKTSAQSYYWGFRG